MLITSACEDQYDGFQVAVVRHNTSVTNIIVLDCVDYDIIGDVIVLDSISDPDDDMLKLLRQCQYSPTTWYIDVTNIQAMFTTGFAYDECKNRKYGKPEVVYQEE
jgi:hypothetical protein